MTNQRRRWFKEEIVSSSTELGVGLQSQLINFGTPLWSAFCAADPRQYNSNVSMDRLHDTRAPFWTGIGTGSRARQVQDPNGGSRVSFRFWSHKKTIPSSSLSFLAAKKTLYLYPFSVVRTSTQSIKTKQQSAPKHWSWNLVEVAWPSTCSACAADSSWWIYRWRAL